MEKFKVPVIYPLLFLIVFTPLVFGAVQPWSIFVFECMASLMICSWFVRISFEKCITLRWSALYLPVIFFVSMVLFQLLLLPQPIIKFLSPATFEIKNTAILFLQQTGFSYLPVYFSLSLNNNATLQELVKFFCLFSVFFLVINEITTLKHINTLLSAVLVTGFLIALFSLIQKFTWNGKLYWFYNFARGDSFGPFVNYDHFGGYMNMVVMAGLGYLLSSIETSKKILVGYMVVIMATSLLLCKSRGAVISFTAGLLFLVSMLFMVRRNYDRKKFLIATSSIIITVCFILLFIYWIDWGIFLERLKAAIMLENHYLDARKSIWTDSLSLVKSFSVIGTGLGTYSFVFPMCQVSYANIFWRYAHNDYLQLLIETGPLAIFSVLVFIFMYFKYIFKNIKDIKNNHIAGLLLGSVVAVVTMLIHSFVDFNLHITSNAFLFSLLMGTSIALSNISKKNKDANAIHFNLSRHKAFMISLLGVSGIITCILFPSTKQYLAYRYSILADKADFDYKQSLLNNTVFLWSMNAEYQHALGIHNEEKAAKTMSNDKHEFLIMAKQELGTSLLLSPAEAGYWASYGWLLGNFGEFNLADRAFQRAIKLAPNRKYINDIYAAFIDQYQNR